jgi:hypothetical protein
MDHDSQPRSGRWRVWSPSFLLIAIAFWQVTLAKTAGLCPWKGGGFGMFATTDTTNVRDMRVFIERSGATEKKEIGPAEEVDALEAKLFPSDTMLTRLAVAVLQREQTDDRPIDAVRLEVWRTEFNMGSLEATERLVRTFTYRVDQNAD